MKLDLGSFAFGSSVKTGGNTPSWGTSLGQVKPELKLTYPGYDNIVIGMVYKSIPVDKVYIPLGKGGHVCNSLEDEGIQLAAMFDKVYINEVRVNAPFIMLIYKEESDSWKGRKTLKYSTKIEYHRGENDIIYNSNFVNAAREALQLADDACWFVSDIFIANQDELHMIAGIVNPFQSETYDSSDLRKTAFINALNSIYDENPHFKKLYGNNDDSKNEVLQQIIYGAPGTGKSNTIKKNTEKAEEDERVFRTTFHPDSDYSTFVGCYKPSMKPTGVTMASGIKQEVITYQFTPQAFTKAYVKAWNTTEKVFLIIEEINRGNCAQIFGDLFQLLDRKKGFSEYPVDADSDLANYLNIELKNSIRDFPKGVQEGKKLVLPNNLYIWATMNTSDQSLFPIDSAFKRRWEWKYIPIKNHQDLDYTIEIGNAKYIWWGFLERINDIISTTTSSEDKKLGYFFAKADDNNVINAEHFVGKVLFYLWNDVFRNYGFDNPIFDKDGKNKFVFSDFFMPDGKPNIMNVNAFMEKLDEKVERKVSMIITKGEDTESTDKIE